MGSMDNGSFNIKQIFVEYIKKKAWPVRVGGLIGGLNGLMPVRPQNSSLRRTESES